MIQSTDQPESTHIRILLVDDDNIVQMVTARLLEQAGYSVEVVGNGLEAIKALESAHYDLVVMDGSMPVMDGFEATRIIRKADSAALNPNIPIIALTALTMQGDQQKCVDAGMNDYVSKPVESSALLAAIERCLGARADEPSDSGQDFQQEQVWDDGFLDTIIDKFLQDLPQVIRDLEQALGRGDVAALRDIGHRLRGSADLLSASTVSKRSRALEEAARGGDLALVTSLSRDLITELQTLGLSFSEE